MKPQYKGICISVITMKPKKPNSAQRKVARIKLKKKEVLAYIPGIGQKITINNILLIRPGKVQDLPGVKYKVIRGTRDSNGVLRSTSRSKYGCKKTITVNKKE